MDDRLLRDTPAENPLGDYLRDFRARLDPVALGFAPGRRRTPGLRREEVASRAHISPTWYTCLEQGRGGAPSAEVLERIARALMMTEAEREHLFMIGLGRSPEGLYHRRDGITPRLQHILDALDPNPAMVRTAAWNIIALNRAAAVLFPNYADRPPDQRNMLRFIFLDPHARAATRDEWEAVARTLVAAFRAGVVKAGAQAEVQALVDELSRSSPEFEAMWRGHDVYEPSEANKLINHPVLGPLEFEHSAFSIDGRPDLTMLVYYPATEACAARIRELVG